MAIVKISRTDEILKQLKKRGKVHSLDGPKYMRATLEMNKAMEKVRRTSRFKQAQSERSAANSFFTC